MASSLAQHLRNVQPELKISDQDILCVTVAGLIHDLGHGPFSHFWEHSFMDKALEGSGKRFEHEDVSCALFDRLLERNGIDATPWLEVPHDLDFIKALVRGRPARARRRVAQSSKVATDGDAIKYEDEMEAAARRMRTVTRREDEGVPGKDKRFLYDIVANKLNGLDVDKLDYFQRDSYFSGVVKVSFDTVRLMMLARVAMVEAGQDNAPREAARIRGHSGRRTGAPGW